MYPSKLTPYLPPLLVDWYRHASPGHLHTRSRHHGTLMCLDVSGFTRLNRELCAASPDGVEQVAEILNKVLSTVRTTAAAHGGQIVKFAGDAAWLFFERRIDSQAYFNDVSQHVDDLNTRWELLAQRPITLHAGVGYGAFDLLSLGGSESRREVELVGPLVREVFFACDQATHGSLLRTTEFEADTTDTSRRLCEPARPLPSADILQKYLPVEILRKISSSGDSGQVAAEVRNVVVLFARVDAGQAISNTDLAGRFDRMFSEVHSSGGNIARVDPYAGGHKLLVLFGAPNADELDTVRALHCAHRLIQSNDDGFMVNCGVAKGSLFCGEAGDAHRKEYTVIGDAINLAARLMAAGNPGEVVFDAVVREVAPPLIVSDDIELQLKGLDGSLTAHRLVRIDEVAEIARHHGEVIGLTREQVLLRRAWRRIAQNRRRHFALTGPAGSGKTALLQTLVSDLGRGQARYLDCKHALLFGRGWLIRQLLQQVFEISGSVETSLEARIVQTIEARWLPLLNDVLGTQWPDNEWTQHLSMDLRANKTARLLASCLRTMVRKRAAVAIDNIDRADDYSQELLPAILNDLVDSRLLVCLSSRAGISDRYAPAVVAEESLRYPSDDEWWQWFRQTFHDGAAERQLFEQLLRAGDGNPRFVREYMRHSLGTGALRPNTVDGRMELLVGNVEVRIPESLSSLHLMQFDQLDEEVRSILKAMAVLGGDVSVDALMPAVTTSIRPHLSDRLTSLCHRGLLERNNSGGYRFVSHALAESIYDCLPHSHRRALHELFARQFESEGHVRASVLAHHFYYAAADSETLYYSLVAARQAVDAHSVLEASQLLARCRLVIERSGEDILSSDQVSLYYSLHTEHYLGRGELTAASGVARRWRRFARTASRPFDAARAAVELAHVMSKQARYGRAAGILNAVLKTPALQDDLSVGARALYILADTLRRQSRFAEARELCEQAISAAQTVGDGQILRRSRNNLGLVLWAEGKLSEAAEVYTEVLAEASRDTGMFSRAQTLNNLAIIHWEQGRFVQAEALMTEALGIFRNLGDRLNEAYASGNLAALRKIVGRFAEARELFELADLVFRRNNDEHAHQYTVGNIGDLDLLTGDMAAARRRFDEVHLFACRVGDQELEAECKVRLGDLAASGGDLDSGLRLISEAAALATTIGSTEYRLRALLALARLHVNRSDVGATEALVADVQQIAGESRSILAARDADFLAAECLRLRQDLSRARELYLKTLAWAEGEHSFELQLKCLTRLVELDDNPSQGHTARLEELASTFARENSPGLWQQLVASPYYSRYAETLRNVVPVEA